MRRRLGHVVFLLSILALLATSKPVGWKITASVSGPTTSTPPKGLRVIVDSSHKPNVVYEDAWTPKPTAVDIDVEATGWGDCTAGPCSAPGTFHVDSIRVK